MRISQLYTYPIKSLRPTALSDAWVTRQGFQYDRRFMLLKWVPDEEEEKEEEKKKKKPKNMHISHIPEMGLFQTDIIFPTDHTPGTLVVTYHPPTNKTGQEDAGAKDNVTSNDRRIEIPLEPDVDELGASAGITVEIHGSPTRAYDMGQLYNDWFSRWFGYDVVLAYLGENGRRVLGTFSPRLSSAHRQPSSSSSSSSSSYSAFGLLSKVAGRIPYLGWDNGGEDEDERITFADCAPYLVVSETSLHDVTGRIGTGEVMDVTKFRPNIVISGAETAWEEDFWGELAIGDQQGGDSTRLLLTANCVRCTSINVDYATGKAGQGESGKILKKLMKDRRVDKGAKYSPVFGRYAFLSKESNGDFVRVGDEVTVPWLIAERTTYDWPGLTN
ncbi:hypothetical protein ASPZODRAFT_106138 [Penicilliopsis zonata CBS 506.65]|uniref:MOSC domain-containing protein n=1 Tax=Penicilliopsis zonata CBS 506.65 TaxID=1073090 RepID=A0A1L9STP6_9EURO|nr:hypothetical protein ASPZODRAFT_106138 [Penicilliopsis zonata CBS 506.65]OJJ50506.1 hypothetical protein ASPZODRAFT_106138 [Penicilliopsis zonata CBS 506.65]